MIIATFDLNEGWTFSGSPEIDFGIQFADGNADRIYPDALAFGWTLLVNGTETETHEWPPSNITIRELAPTRVFPYRLDVKPEDEVTLLVWATNAGVTVDGETTFTIPRPGQPYPSWVWENGAWTPPAPYPDDNGFYSWNEDQQAWVKVAE